MTAGRATVLIDEARCKGCGLCVVVCPPRVLQMSNRRNAQGYHVVELTPGCTGCENCQRMCPDFVFEVYRASKAPVGRSKAEAGEAGEEGGG
jgi:2-oxoglutarate ferredoxin oxidoreductase subunit delta